MTGGGDLDEYEDDVDGELGLDGGDEDGDEPDVSDLNENDDDPTAGASDIGGRAGDDADDARGEDGHEAGGGQTGMGKGPTGS